MEDAVKRSIIKELTKKYYEAVTEVNFDQASKIHDEIARWEKELGKEEQIVNLNQSEIKFDGNTAIIPDQVKTQITRRFKGLCTHPEGCERKIMSKGLCRMHYQRARKERLAK